MRLTAWCLNILNTKLNRLFRTWSKRRVVVASRVLVFAKPMTHHDENCNDVPLDAIPLSQINEIKINDCEGVGRDSKVEHKKRSGKREKLDSSRISCDDLKNETNESALKGSFYGLKYQRKFLKTVGRAMSYTGLSNASDSLPKAGSEAEQDKAPDAMNRTMEVKTDVDGYNSGRIYFIRMASEEECLRIARLLSDLSKRSRRLIETQTRLQVHLFVQCRLRESTNLSSRRNLARTSAIPRVGIADNDLTRFLNGRRPGPLRVEKTA
jgi:hypothetical protein